MELRAIKLSALAGSRMTMTGPAIKAFFPRDPLASKSATVPRAAKPSSLGLESIFSVGVAPAAGSSGAVSDAVSLGVQAAIATGNDVAIIPKPTKLPNSRRFISNLLSFLGGL